MDNIIAQAIKELESNKPLSGVSAALYAKRLYSKALRGIIYDGKRAKSLFAKGLNSSICNNIRIYLGKHPRAPVTKLICIADRLLRIADRSVRKSEAIEYNPTQLTVRRSRSYTHAVMTSDHDGRKSTLEAAPKPWNRWYDDRRQPGRTPQMRRFVIAAYVWWRKTLNYSTPFCQNSRIIFRWDKTTSGVLAKLPGQFSPNLVGVVEDIVEEMTVCDVVMITEAEVAAGTKEKVSLFLNM